MNRKNWIFLIFGLVVVVVLTVGCSIFSKDEDTASQPTEAVPTVTSDNGVISEGSLIPKEDKYLGFMSGGEVEEVTVKKGDLVNEGQVLARLSGREQAQAALDAANLELLNAQQAYDDLQRLVDITRTTAWQDLISADDAVIVTERAWEAIDTEETQTAIEEAEIEVADTKKVLTDAQETFDKYKDLPEDNQTRKDAQTELDQAQKDYDEAVRKRDELINARDIAQANYEAAQAAQVEAQYVYDNLQTGPDPDQLALADARLKHANTQVIAAQTALDTFDLKAPFTGTVVDVSIIPGQVIAPGNWAFLLADFSEWYVETIDLTEMDVVKITDGMRVSIIPDALKDIQLTGTVVEIGQAPGQASGDIVYTARIKLDETDPLLRWGMTMEVTFEIDK
jgi:multidrug resistance efflux pump